MLKPIKEDKRENLQNLLDNFKTDTYQNDSFVVTSVLVLVRSGMPGDADLPDLVRPEPVDVEREQRGGRRTGVRQRPEHQLHASLSLHLPDR